MLKVNLKLFDEKGKGDDPNQTPAFDAEAYEAKLNGILDSAQKKADDIIAEAQKKAESIVKQAGKGAKATAPDEISKDKAAHDAYMNERVPVRLFKDGEKYKDDVAVTLNGETILIQRGKLVQIPRKFALVLENSQMQDVFAADHMTNLADQYKKSEPFLS
jgi:ElaB/YqjD/DUF883 family membrane-anchored ribosome-binding protein